MKKKIKVKAALVVFEDDAYEGNIEAVLEAIRHFRGVGSTEEEFREIEIPCEEGESIWNALRSLKIQFAEQVAVYPLLKGTKVLAIYTSFQDAFDELAKCPDDEFEYQVEHWPLDQMLTKFNVSVVKSK